MPLHRCGDREILFIVSACSASEILDRHAGSIQLLEQIQFNRGHPFMKNMNAEQLVERVDREAAGLERLPIVALKSAATHPKINVRSLASSTCPGNADKLGQ